MSKTKIICKVCKEKQEHQAFGMCGKCYRKDYREKNKERIAKVTHKKYMRHREKNIAVALKWREENFERWKENKKRSNKKYYKTDKRKAVLKRAREKDKSKHNSRCLTWAVIYGRNHFKPLGLPKEFFICKCGSVDVEIHHEIYPKTKPEIVKAIDEGKIYCLCNRCHNNTHGKIRALPSKTKEDK